MVGVAVHEKEGVDGMTELERELNALQAKVRRAKKEIKDQERAQMLTEGVAPKISTHTKTFTVAECGNCGELFVYCEYIRKDDLPNFCRKCGARVKRG